MVIDDSRKWDGPRIIMVGGSKAVFKFVHKAGPLMTSVHLYDYMVGCCTRLRLDSSFVIPGQ